MSMKNIVNMLIVLAIVVGGLYFIGSKASMPTGGTFNPVKVDFAEGISVDGTTRISGTGAFTAAGLTTTTLTTSSTANLGVVGAGAYVTRPVLAPAADTTLTVAQSGAIVQMAVAGLDVTLPTPTTSAGVGYRFVVSAAVATTDMTIVAGTADTLEGTLIVAGAVVDCDAGDLLTFVIDGENIGDYVDVYSDGTKWMVGDSGVLTAGKLTCSG